MPFRDQPDTEDSYIKVDKLYELLKKHGAIRVNKNGKEEYLASFFHRPFPLSKKRTKQLLTGSERCRISNIQEMADYFDVDINDLMDPWVAPGEYNPPSNIDAINKIIDHFPVFKDPVRMEVEFPGTKNLALLRNTETQEVIVLLIGSLSEVRGELELLGSRMGSVILEIMAEREDAQRILHAFDVGRLDALAILSIRPKSETRPFEYVVKGDLSSAFKERRRRGEGTLPLEYVLSDLELYFHESAKLSHSVHELDPSLLTRSEMSRWLFHFRLHIEKSIKLVLEALALDKKDLTLYREKILKLLIEFGASEDKPSQIAEAKTSQSDEPGDTNAT